MSMWSAIYIDNCWVLLCRVEVNRFHHSPVEIGCSVSCFDGSIAVFRHLVSLPRVWSREIMMALWLRVQCDELVSMGHCRLAVTVDQCVTSRIEACIMVSLAIVKECSLARIDVNHPRVSLYWVAFTGCIDDAF